MNLTHVEAESYVEAFLHEVGEVNDVDIVIIPSFTSYSNSGSSFR